MTSRTVLSCCVICRGGRASGQPCGWTATIRLCGITSRRFYGIRGKSTIEDALSEVTTRHAFNPLKDYLLGLTWDGIPRLDTVFIDYLGAEDTEFNRAITRKTLAAAVGRALEPGIKFDTVLTLIGKQGQGKTSLCASLRMAGTLRAL